MAGLQSGEGRMMIDVIESVIWAKYINVTDTVAIATATLTHCTWRQKQPIRSTSKPNGLLFLELT